MNLILFERHDITRLSRYHQRRLGPAYAYANIERVYCLRKGIGAAVIWYWTAPIWRLQSTVAFTLLWPTANTLVKISVLHFYTKIFSTRQMAYCVYTIGAVTWAYWLSTVLTAFLICRPFAFNWNKLIAKGHCGNTSAYYLSTGIVNLCIDVAIVALPLPMLLGLQMKTSKKIMLIGIFSLGALWDSIALPIRDFPVLTIFFNPSICIISIIRVVTLKRLNLSLDLTYDSVLDNICTSLEPTLGVINACLPLLRPVISKLSGSIINLRSKLSSSGGTPRQQLGSKETPFESSDRPKSRKLHRLPGDLYPLTDVTATQSHCTGPDLRSDELEWRPRVFARWFKELFWQQDRAACVSSFFSSSRELYRAPALLSFSYESTRGSLRAEFDPSSEGVLLWARHRSK